VQAALDICNIRTLKVKKYFHCFKELWTNNALQENDWNRENVDDNYYTEERERERESSLV
jgi:hypothetical protein